MPSAGDIVNATDTQTTIVADFGPWTGYTPGLTNVTLGTGTLTGEFLPVGKLVHFKIALTFGSTTAFTGAPRFGLPVTAADSQWVAPALLFDSSTGATQTPGVCSVNSSTMVPYGINGPVDASHPFTWAVGDIIRITGTYEAL